MRGATYLSLPVRGFSRRHVELKTTTSHDTAPRSGRISWRLNYRMFVLLRVGPNLAQNVHSQ
jgi:hypothetical protein